MKEYRLEVFKNRTLRDTFGSKSLKRGKVHPRTGHVGPKGEQKYKSTFSLTSALDVGGWSTPRVGPLTPGNDPVAIA